MRDALRLPYSAGAIAGHSLQWRESVWGNAKIHIIRMGLSLQWWQQLQAIQRMQQVQQTQQRQQRQHAHQLRQM
jgi:hypothetical protein